MGTEPWKCLERFFILGSLLMRKSTQQRIWTREEDEYMANHFGHMAPSEIAKQLGRSPQSVKCRAFILGLQSGSKKQRERITKPSPGITIHRLLG
jgi:hypothetical protein